MRILMVGKISILPMQRPVNWMLEKGCHTLVVGNTLWKPSSCLEHYRVDKFLTFRGADKIKFFNAPLWALQLRNAYRKFKPHIIHAHNTLLPTYACLLAGLKPIVVSVWGGLNSLMDSDLRQNDPYFFVKRRLLRTADAIIVESPNLEKAYRETINNSQRIASIPLGVNTRVFAPQNPSARASWREKLQIPDHSKVLLSPRGWAPFYGHRYILEAFAKAHSNFRHQTYLVFCKLSRSREVREVQKQIDFIQERAEQLGIAKSIRWLPPLEYTEMPFCYAFSDIVISYPSTDAFPSTLLEAAASLRPIISSRLPAYKNTLIDDVCTLVEPKNPEALAEAMVATVNTPAEKLLPKLLWARQEIVERYEETIMKERLIGLYRELASTST